MPEGEIRAIFVYFHGGGLEHGSKNPEDPFIGYLIQRGIAVADVNYRMYPDAKFPDFVEDAADAVAWAWKNMPKHTACREFYVGGSSAGGYLSMMLCFDPKYLGRHGLKSWDIRGYIHDAGQPTAHFNVLREQGVDTRRLIVDETAPLYHVGAYGNECSRMLFVVSDNDMANRYEQTMLMLSTLKHFDYDQEKISWKLMHGKHCAYVRALDEKGESVFGKIIFGFIQENA